LKVPPKAMLTCDFGGIVVARQLVNFFYGDQGFQCILSSGQLVYRAFFTALNWSVLLGGKMVALK